MQFIVTKYTINWRLFKYDNKSKHMRTTEIYTKFKKLCNPLKQGRINIGLLQS